MYIAPSSDQSLQPLNLPLTLKRLGGGALDISHDYSATRKALAATLYDFFLSSFPHILTPICDARGYGSEVT